MSSRSVDVSITWLDVLPVDDNPVVSICAFLFVVEAERVKEFVHYCSVAGDTRINQRQSLTATNATDVR